MTDRVHIDVGGQVYTIPCDLIENGPQSRLQEMYRSASTTSRTYRICLDRPVEMFSAILAMYQTGELHIPMTSCPGAFMNELAFWEIPVEKLSMCCYNRLQCFLDEQETLKKFRESLEGDTHPKLPQSSASCIQTARYKLWSLVEYRQPSLAARIYFVLTFFMVLLSIFILAVKTDSTFQRAMTNCERLEYMISTGMEDVDLVRETLEKYCGEDTIPNQHVVEGLRRGEFEDESYDYFTEFYITVDSNDTLSGEYTFNSTDNSSIPLVLKSPYPKGKFVKVPNMKVTIYILTVLEVITLVYFTGDLVVRLLSCPSVIQYFVSIINITDALALVCTYVHLLVLYVYEHQRYRDGMIDLLEYSQMLRALRLFRIVSNIRAGKVLAYSIRANLKDLSILFLFLVAGVCTFASCFYIAEDKMDVSSILTGWYWAIVTMTTVGYGDISPKSPFGRVVACVCGISGVLLFALTLPIFANHFITLYQHTDTRHAFRMFRGSESRNNSDNQFTIEDKGEKVTSRVKKNDKV